MPGLNVFAAVLRIAELGKHTAYFSGGDEDGIEYNIGWAEVEVAQGFHAVPAAVELALVAAGPLGGEYGVELALYAVEVEEGVVAAEPAYAHFPQLLKDGAFVVEVVAQLYVDGVDFALAADKLEVDGLRKHVGGVCGGSHYARPAGDVVAVGAGDADGHSEPGAQVLHRVNDFDGKRVGGQARFGVVELAYGEVLPQHLTGAGHHGIARGLRCCLREVSLYVTHGFLPCFGFVWQ